MNKKLISFVLPAYCEEGNISTIHHVLTKELQKLSDYNYEIIFVNDGSPDNTWGEIQKICDRDTRTKGICLSRNFGKEIALTTGVQRANGDAVITLDTDGQHPVTKIPDFIMRWEKGYNVVYNKRNEIQGASWFKKRSSLLFYKIFNLISDIKMESGVTDYRLLDRRVVNVFKQYPEKNRIYRGIVDMIGFKRHCLVFDALPNPEGRDPSYSYTKLLRLAIDSFTSFSTFPLKLVGYVGVIIILFSAILLAIISLDKLGLVGLNFTNISIVIVINTFLIGIVLVSLGLLALYIERIHDEVVNRPLYIIQEEFNFIENNK